MNINELPTEILEGVLTAYMPNLYTCVFVCKWWSVISTSRTIDVVDHDIKQIRSLYVRGDMLSLTRSKQFNKKYFEYACEGGYVELVQPLLDPDHNEHGLFHASSSGKYDAVVLLLSQKVKINNGLNGACYGNHLWLVNKLIILGAKNYDDALVHACEGGSLTCITRMLECGAIRINDGLRAACSRGNISTAVYMISMGAAVTNQLYIVACSHGHIGMINFLHLIVEPDIHLLNTCLDDACHRGDVVTSRLLILKGANALNTNLYCACHNGDIDMVNMLIEEGATDCEHCHREPRYH